MLSASPKGPYKRHKQRDSETAHATHREREHRADWLRDTQNTINQSKIEEEKPMKCNVVFEKKIGKNFEQTWSSDDKERVYEDLTHELVVKKLCGCSYIRSITRKQLYNGFVKITVTYDNGDRRIYTINDH